MIIETDLRIKEAWERGWKEGIEKGEKVVFKMMAKKMLEQHLSLDLIKELTHLTDEEIKNLTSERS